MENENTKEKSSKAWMYLLAIIAVLCFGGAVWVFIQAPNWKTNYQHVGAVGDFFNGMLAPFIAFIGALLTFAAFYVQYQANEAQKKELKKQSEALEEQKVQQRIDRFEFRFFEMLKIHRENVDRFSLIVSPTKSGLRSFKGYQAFWVVIYEVEFVLSFLRTFMGNDLFEILNSNQKLATSAYKMVYWGYQNDAHLIKRWSQFEFEAPIPSQELLDKLVALKEFANDGMNFESKGNTETSKPGLNFEPEMLESFFRGLVLLAQFHFPVENYRFCDGHSMFLGQYFRHLFQIYELIEGASNEFGDKIDAYHYAKLARAQMADFEQRILCYNLQTKMGQAWWDKGYIVKYKPLKNIPLDEIPHEFLPVRKLRDNLINLGLPYELPDLQKYFDFKITAEMLEENYVGLGRGFPAFEANTTKD